MHVERDSRDYDLTCWYLNQRRVFELVGAAAFKDELTWADSLSEAQSRHNAKLSIYKNALTDWLNRNGPPTLGRLIISKEVAEGAFFTHFTNYFCRGLGKVHDALRQHKAVPMAEAYAKLDDLQQGLRITCRFSHEHLTSNSSWSELSGQKRLLVLGLITSMRDNVIEAIPYVIANPVPSFMNASPLGNHWQDRLEVFIDSIDSFERVQEVPPRRTKGDLDALRKIPEREIKAAFAEIIGEQVVPKDWGGERSDLTTTRLKLDGQRVSTAFLFKGPAVFEPLTPAKLGKNGDQIDRLFSEPADFLVLQHCHEITMAVRGQMRAYAQQFGNLRRFCLIDGYDTVRLLRAYKKCGFK